MSPLSPLRTFALGAFSWLILGLGLYCLWVGYTRTQPRTSVASYPLRDEAVKLDSPTIPDKQLDVERPDLEPQRTGDPTESPRRIESNRRAWTYFVCGGILTLLSIGGFWPANFLLSSGALTIPQIDGGKSFDISSSTGAKIRVEVFDHAVSPTLLFTHGWSLDRTAWNYAIKRFRGQYRLVTWDLPGLGESSAPADKKFSMDRFAGDLQQVIGSIDNGRPIILIGHSIGGMIIQTYLKLFPKEEHIKAIVLVHTTYTNPLKTMLGAPLWTAIDNVVVIPLHWLIIAFGPAAYLMNWQSYLNGSLNTTARITSFTGRQSRHQLNYASLLSAKAWPPHIARGNLAMMDFDSQVSLPQIKLPLLVIAGRHDRVTMPKASERIADLAGASKLEYVDGGHLSIWEFQSEVLDSMEHFILKTNAEHETLPSPKQPD